MLQTPNFKMILDARLFRKGAQGILSLKPEMDDPKLSNTALQLHVPVQKSIIFNI